MQLSRQLSKPKFVLTLSNFVLDKYGFGLYRVVQKNGTKFIAP